jgi:hypothetical protein
LEATTRARDEPFEDPRDALGLYREVLDRRAIPLPPLDGVDLDATAELWSRGGEWAGFVMDDGIVRTAVELAGKGGVAR